MRISRIFVMVAAVLVLTACRGHETITGGYGDLGVSGVVTMAAGMPNSSPSGVRVGVGGTGMSAVLGPDGRFAFFGVPETAELIFTRDDVDARMRVAASFAPLSIELNSNSARNGRSRSVTPGPQLQVEGLIASISDTQIVVHDSHNNDVTLMITTNTAIYKGHQALTPSDLKAGDRVHVKASVSGDTKTALLIILQNPDDGDHNNGGDTSGTMTANGTVTANSGSELTVSTVPKGSAMVKVDGRTIIRKQGNLIGVGDIHVSDEVNCKGTRVDDHTLLARQIEVRGVSGHH